MDVRLVALPETGMQFLKINAQTRKLCIGGEDELVKFACYDVRFPILPGRLDIISIDTHPRSILCFAWLVANAATVSAR